MYTYISLPAHMSLFPFSFAAMHIDFTLQQCCSEVITNCLTYSGEAKLLPLPAHLKEEVHRYLMSSRYCY